jgi:hypothetical protein
MSTIKVDIITDEAGSGAPDFPNGMTGNGSSLTGLATSAQGALADTALQSSSSLAAANLTGALPAIDGSALTGVGASTTLAAVGTYALARQISGTVIYTHGHTRSGTGMEWADVNNGSSGAINVGTWRAMGRANNNLQSTLYLRIA